MTLPKEPAERIGVMIARVEADLVAIEEWHGLQDRYDAVFFDVMGDPTITPERRAKTLEVLEMQKENRVWCNEERDRLLRFLERARAALPTADAKITKRLSKRYYIVRARARSYTSPKILESTRKMVERYDAEHANLLALTEENRRLTAIGGSTPLPPVRPN
jgi:hypothetical protein